MNEKEVSKQQRHPAIKVLALSTKDLGNFVEKTSTQSI